MIEKRLILSGLLKQRTLLSDLILQLESKPSFEHADCETYAEFSKRIEKNLKRLRILRRHCFDCDQPGETTRFDAFNLNPQEGNQNVYH